MGVARWLSSKECVCTTVVEDSSSNSKRYVKKVTIPCNFSSREFDSSGL